MSRSFHVVVSLTLMLGVLLVMNSVRVPSYRPRAVQSTISTRLRASSTDVLIVGAGISGLSTAVELQNKMKTPRIFTLAMSAAEYIGIVTWSAEQLKAKERQPPPPDCDSIFRKYGIEPTHWCNTVEYFGTIFHRAIGHRDKLAQVAVCTGRNWLKGSRICGDVFT